MKKLIEHGIDDHPSGQGDKEATAWSVAVLDDCEACGDLRVELTLEEVGRAGYGQVAHLSPDSARRLYRLLSRALAEVGEPVPPGGA